MWQVGQNEISTTVFPTDLSRSKSIISVKILNFFRSKFRSKKALYFVVKMYIFKKIGKTKITTLKIRNFLLSFNMFGFRLEINAETLRVYHVSNVTLAVLCFRLLITNTIKIELFVPKTLSYKSANLNLSNHTNRYSIYTSPLSESWRYNFVIVLASSWTSFAITP